MRNYELIYIIHPDLDDSSVSEMMERINGWITESDGEILETDVWGKRRLAYQINKQDEGQYIYQQIRIDPTFCAEIEQNIRIQESIMRYSLIAKE